MTGRGRAAPVVAGLVVAAWVLAFRRYAPYDLADEGLLLAQAARAAAGERPYIDFHTGYGPLYFAIHAALVRAGGLEAVRVALAVVHGVTAGLMFVVARALGGSAMAVAALALHVAFFLPLAPARGAPFNVPYPAWWAGLGGAVITVLVAHGAACVGRLALAGAVTGAVFAMKPNSGALLAAGAAVACVTTGAGGRRVVAAVVAAAALLAVVVLVTPTGASEIALVLVVPVAALVWRARGLLAPDAEALPRLAALGAGFLVVAGAALGPTIVALGPTRFRQEVLHVGTGVADLFLLPIGWPAVAATVLGLVGLASGAPRAVVVAGVALLAVVIVGGALEGPPSAAGLRQGAERAAVAVVPLTLLGGVALLARRPRVAPVLAVAALGAAQLYPRPDLDHLMPLASLVLPLAMLLWREALEGLGLRRERAVAAAVGVVLVLAAGRFVPSGRALIALLGGEAEAVRLPADTLVALPEGRARLEAIAAAAAAVADSSTPADRVLAFPACAAIPFFAGRLPAGPHDYFYPGRPTREEIAALVARLRPDPPPVAVTCDAPGRLADAWAAYPELVELLERRYRVVLDRTPLTVRRRID